MKKNDYLDIDFYDISPAFPLSRREFLKLMGGGIVILFTVGDPFDLEAQRRRGQPLPDDFNAFLRVGEDGQVTCFTGKDMVMGDTDLCPWDRGTFGSMTTRFFGPPLRAAAAEARAVLLELAAEYLQTSPSQLKAEAGIIYHRSQRQKKVP